MTDVRVEFCDPSQWREALRLLYEGLSEPQRSEQVAESIDSARRGELRLDGLVIGKDAQGLLGTVLCMEGGGRTIMLWPPRLASRASGAARMRLQGGLILRVREFAATRRARLVQTLLGEDEQWWGAVLRAAGFRRLTHLVYLSRRTSGSVLAGIPAPMPGLEFHSYRPPLHQDFLQTLGQSYEGSLDCPELNGMRTLEEIFEGHRTQGEFDPGRWFLARRNGRWAGCLLMVGLPAHRALEIAYVAVLPHARRHGIGRELVRRAVREGITASVDFVTLAVDGRNEPARRMYESEGFEPWDCRDAYLLLLDPADGRPEHADAGIR